MRYSIEPRIRKYVTGQGFSSFARKYEQQLLDTRLDSFKIASKKACEFIGDEIVDAVTKSNNDNIEKKEPVEEIIIQLEKR